VKLKFGWYFISSFLVFPAHSVKMLPTFRFSKVTVIVKQKNSTNLTHQSERGLLDFIQSHVTESVLLDGNCLVKKSTKNENYWQVAKPLHLQSRFEQLKASLDSNYCSIEITRSTIVLAIENEYSCVIIQIGIYIKLLKKIRFADLDFWKEQISSKIIYWQVMILLWDFMLQSVSSLSHVFDRVCDFVY